MVFLYLMLCVGAVTTLYPFLLMITTGLKAQTDQSDNRLIPLYLHDNSELLTKFVDDKYASNANLIASTRTGIESSPDDVQRYREFLMTLPQETWIAGFRIAPSQVTSRLANLYHNWLRERFHGDIDALNKAYIEEAVSFGTVETPPELPNRKSWSPPEGKKWSDFVEFKESLPAEYRIPILNQRLWQDFLRAKYQNQISLIPADAVAGAKTIEAIPLPKAKSSALWKEFISTALPERFKEKSVEDRWAEFSGGMTRLPIETDERLYVSQHASELKREFAGRNYAYVLDYILLHGRALWNTVLFCLLAIGTQLIVNPLAAYALSRYPVRQSAKILMFLLATMAFPAEVAMIPSFLLLKSLGLLNTFAALVLPGAASGYMIFLLKGFFDSLPQELYEAGALDGAKETTMLMRIAIPLSKPVLGYLALLAFMAAYGSFIYAFLIAQDQRMWTLMVYVYQLQNIAPKSVMMAALTLAALPTLLVFLFTQRVIMRGIVLPGER